MKYTHYGLSLLVDLDRYYQQAAIEVKSKIVSSIFAEKLIFAEKKYRTPKVNEVLSLITSNINHLGIPKKQKAVKFDSLRRMASHPGFIFIGSRLKNLLKRRRCCCCNKEWLILARIKSVLLITPA